MQWLSMVIGFFTTFTYEILGTRISDETREKIDQFSFLILFVISTALAQVELAQQRLAETMGSLPLIHYDCSAVLNEYGIPVRNCELVRQPGAPAARPASGSAFGNWVKETLFSVLLDGLADLLGIAIGKAARRRLSIKPTPT